MRLVTALAISSALIVGSIAAVDVAAAGTGHDAVAAKKKKKKKKKKDPIFKAIAGKSLNRVISHSPPAANGVERWDFCRNGTYLYQKTDYGFDPNLGDVGLYQTSYNGSWRISNSAGSQGIVLYSVGNFVSYWGAGGPGPDTSPPSSSAAPILLGPFGVNFGGAQYTFGSGAC